MAFINGELSEIEIKFMNIMNHIECMSVREAYIILVKYFNCTEGQVYKILKHLKQKFYLRFTQDEKYIVVGNKEKDGNEGKLSKKTIVAFYATMLQMINDDEDIDAYQFIYKPGDNGTLAFVSGGQLYRIYVVTSKDIYRLRIVEDTYKTKYRRLNNDRKAEGMKFDEISVFIVMEPQKEEDVLNKIEELNLEIPHRIMIPTSLDCSGDINFNQYDCLE